ncbi:MAG: formyltetrahydrofolate deformylase [Candidatus Lambdaproteobacteria bacterium RIFOXYD12_FULL_49_8]|uniref:Formyltetrahydrofolate deformylase n=1 Tax=Candidatus Lambdaproteobacteria bacterium RIFOXYD2_FULL_50_16 TaxID=1817772 RepID=A0A1F6G8R4_9PROT|nr:MAG: formyltetrahydrofolate deformylase [Candidatus Lambdaproteobacteria bacterium RIFOXYD2_FULL_50_16]OGG97338.1 MAG: formyltetrahydrofolate deformylase [Candidatus Lambdaproteobacteria bacterium RIFOXYD12_FULL_49_8]
MSKRAILLIHCPDQKGLVAKITDFLFKLGGNITYLDQYVDVEGARFFMRVEWELQGFKLYPDAIGPIFGKELGEPLNLTWRLYFSDQRPKVAIFCSKEPHCLDDILARKSSGEWELEIPLILSNHRLLEPTAKRFGIEFAYVPVLPEKKEEAEKAQLALLKKHQIDFIVLARYMQIISETFIEQYPNKIINIHHSFLPAFAGAKPYHAAFERGVKLIGATSHYVTADLDSGPIIEQSTTPVTHHDRIEDLIRKGRDQEKLVLAKAIWLHLNRKILVFQNRTVVFV